MKNKYASKDSSRRSFDRQAPTYDSDRNGAHARQMYAHVLDKMYGTAFSSVLDVGCGTGEMLQRIAENFPDARLTGLDLSPKMLETAGEKLGKNAVLALGDAENMPFDDEIFDILLCNDSFHHYPVPEKALEEFMRVLKPGGTLLLSDYRMSFPWRQLMNAFIRFSDDGDVRIYSEKEISDMLHHTGFRDISYEKAGRTGFTAICRK